MFSGCLGSADIEFKWDIGSGDVVMAGRYVALIQGSFGESVLNCSYECGAKTMVENTGSFNSLRDLPRNMLTSLGPLVKKAVVKGGQTSDAQTNRWLVIVSGLQIASQVFKKVQSELERFDDVKKELKSDSELELTGT